MEFFQLWDEHLSENIKQDTISQRLEFKLNVYFAVYALLQRSNLGNQVSLSLVCWSQLCCELLRLWILDRLLIVDLTFSGLDNGLEVTAVFNFL